MLRLRQSGLLQRDVGACPVTVLHTMYALS